MASMSMSIAKTLQTTRSSRTTTAADASSSMGVAALLPLAGGARERGSDFEVALRFRAACQEPSTAQRTHLLTTGPNYNRGLGSAMAAMVA